MTAPVRCIELLLPDWPITAWRRSEGAPAEGPVAVVETGRVVACSDTARREGVRPGLQRREAQSRCPGLVVAEADPQRDARAFAPVIARIEQSVPGVELLRPGLCLLRARGPARYFGGERAAARLLLDLIAELGIRGARVGVADGPFAAEQAALRADPLLIVPEGQAGAFLAGLPVAALGDAELTELLPRLGLHELGGFAALDAALVRDRFGDRGARLHALASGRDPRGVMPRTPPPELARAIDFEPPLEIVEQVAFAVRRAADELIAGIAAAGLVCTELRVELVDARGEGDERLWLHPDAFDAGAVVDRVRWQLAGAQRLEAGIRRVRLEPEAVDAAHHHEPGLFGGGPEERLHHALSRLQAVLGHDGVLVPAVGGGRWLAERQRLVPWGERRTGAIPADRPWPGRLPAPLPAAVFDPLRPVDVLDAEGRPVGVDARGRLSAAPARLVDGVRSRVLVGWAGPWAVDERGWDPARHRRACRLQALDAEQTGWLLVLERGGWHAEGRYD